MSVLPGGVTVDVAHVELTARGMPQGANPHGTIQGRLAVPSGEGEVIEANASFAGTVGGIPTTAQGTLRGDRLDASVDVPEVAAEKIRALSPQVPMYQPAAAHAEGHGQLSSLGVTARASVGGGRIDMRGTVTLMGRLGGAVALDVRKMDLRAFVPAAPRSSVDFHTDVHADTRADGLLSGAFSLDVPEGGSLAGQSIPAATFRGNFDQKPGDAVFVVETTGNVSEPGAPIALSAHARTGEPAPVVDFVASSQIVVRRDCRRRRRGACSRARSRGESKARGEGVRATVVAHAEGRGRHLTGRDRRARERGSNTRRGRAARRGRNLDHRPG